MKFPIIVFLLLPFLGTSQNETDCLNDIIPLAKMSIAFIDSHNPNYLNLAVITNKKMCIDEDDILMMVLNDESKIVLNNWSSFSCNGSAGYLVGKEDLLNIVQHGVFTITIQGFDKFDTAIFTKSQNNSFVKKIKCLLPLIKE